jgi:hypothetical protein
VPKTYSARENTGMRSAFARFRVRLSQERRVQGDPCGPGGPPHKRLLKRGSFSLPFRFCKSLCDFWPIREGVPQSVCGQDCCANLTKHVLHFPPPAPARHPIHIPRGKAFLQPRSCARRADWSTTSRVTKPGNSLGLSWEGAPVP